MKEDYWRKKIRLIIKRKKTKEENIRKLVSDFLLNHEIEPTEKMIDELLSSLEGENK